MNLKRISEYWHLLEAAKAGKVIQNKMPTGSDPWYDLPQEYVTFCEGPEKYRVKPEPVVQETWTDVYSSGTAGVRYYNKSPLAAHVEKDGTLSGYLYTRLEDDVLVEQKLIPVGGACAKP